MTKRKLGYKSNKIIHQPLTKDLLEDYIYVEKSERVYLILELQDLPTLTEKISANIQFRTKILLKKGTKFISNRSTLYH